MTQHQFRDRLASLIDQFLHQGGDAFWLNSELLVAGMRFLDELRCDLAECDDDPFSDTRGRNSVEAR